MCQINYYVQWRETVVKTSFWTAEIINKTLSWLLLHKQFNHTKKHFFHAIFVVEFFFSVINYINANLSLSSFNDVYSIINYGCRLYEKGNSFIKKDRDYKQSYIISKSIRHQYHPHKWSCIQVISLFTAYTFSYYDLSDRVHIVSSFFWSTQYWMLGWDVVHPTKYDVY